MRLEEALISVWRQALVEGVEAVKLNGRRFLVRRTLRKHLRQVDFNFDGEPVRGLEQNPETSSHWGAIREVRSPGQAVSLEAATLQTL